MTAVLPLAQLVAHPANARRELGDLSELTASIRAVGILQPLLVMRAPAKPGTFVILAGHRRAAAARLLFIREVPCVITSNAATISDQLVLMLTENMQRTDLTPVEKAETFGELRARGMTAREIAGRVGLTEATVSYYLTLLELAPSTLEDVRNGRLAVGIAVDAVKQTRRETRRAEGHQRVGPPTVVEPHYFTTSHPLAAAARGMCTHHARPKVGGNGRGGRTACGQCWEAAIRADERQAGGAA